MATSDTGTGLVLGASDLANPTGSWGDYEGYLSFGNGGIDVRDGGAFASIGSYVDYEWYNIWMVLDNTIDWTTVYASQGNDPAVLLGDGAFRNGTTDVLATLKVKIGGSGSTYNSYLDDVYIDTTGVNLNLPAGVGVPEPTSLVLLGLGVCSLLFNHRRRA